MSSKNGNNVKRVGRRPEVRGAVRRDGDPQKRMRQGKRLAVYSASPRTQKSTCLLPTRKTSLPHGQTMTGLYSPASERYMHPRTSGKLNSTPFWTRRPVRRKENSP